MNHDDEIKNTWENLRRDADKGREPQLLSAQLGQRQVSFRALLERIEYEFIEEHRDSSALREADTPTKRLKLLLPTVDYVLAVESMQVSAADKAALMNATYSSLFGYGPLDELLLDERVTTIAIEGAEKVSVRYGHGDLVSLGPKFEDEAHLKRILRRLLLDAGADLYDGQPFVETGLTIDRRPVCITVITPLMSFGYHADIRVHPHHSLSLDNLVQSEFLTGPAAHLLKAIARSAYGCVIVGDTESGKTTLLNALAQMLPNPEETVAIERAGELRLPEGMRRLVVRWPSEGHAGITFGEQIGFGLEMQPACILLDEIRTDEPESIAPLLQNSQIKRQIWSFRGPFDAKRLRSALSMLARRADMSQSEAMVEAMYQRLPFIVTLWRAHGRIGLYSVAEWQYRASDYPDYILLMQNQDGRLQLTGEKPSKALDLPDSFWSGQ